MGTGWRYRRQTGDEFIMKDATKRSIVRWIHIICGIPIIGYIYSPFDAIPDYAPATRFVFLPAMLLSGLWMWKGHVLRRLRVWRRNRDEKQPAAEQQVSL
jgi:hypothetical protein